MQLKKLRKDENLVKAGFHLNLFRGVKSFRKKPTKNNKIKIVLRNTVSLHMTLHFIMLLLGSIKQYQRNFHASLLAVLEKTVLMQ